MVGGLIQMMNPKVFVTSTCQEASQDVKNVVATSSENDEQASGEDGKDMEYKFVSDDDNS